MSAIDPDLHISLLGPVRARRGEADVALGGRRQKAVLARLAIVAGDVVPADRLIDDIWAGEPPASAANTLQSYVSNLRRELGGGPTPAIERVGDGYRLAGSIDLVSARFEALVAETSGPGSDRLGADERIARLDRALDLWHGQAVADFAEEPWARGAAVRLDELRLAAEEARFDLLLDAGRHAVAVGELSAAVDAHPLRERFTAQLVLALYRCGRQSEALRAFERTRAHLGEELGLDPSPSLVALADQVLRHDPALDRPPGAGPAAPGPTAPPTGGAVVAPGDRLPLPPAVTERRERGTFVGRDEALAALDATWSLVTGGDQRLASVTGEPGMGKTRLAQVFARRYRREPRRGYGGTAHQILRAIGDGVHFATAAGQAFSCMGSMGNGAAMRVAPLGAYFAEDLAQVVAQARASAAVTHAHPDGQAGAIAVAVAAAGACTLPREPELGWRLLEPGHKLRRIWQVAAALTVALWLVWLPNQYDLLKTVDTDLSDQALVERDLEALVDEGAFHPKSDIVPASGKPAELPVEDCLPISVPNHRAVPRLAFWLDIRPSDVVSIAAADEQPKSGFFLAPAREFTVENFILDPGEPGRAVTKPPPGFYEVARNRSWVLYSTCLAG